MDMRDYSNKLDLRKGRDVCLCLRETMAASQTSAEHRMVPSIVFPSLFPPFAPLL